MGTVQILCFRLVVSWVATNELSVISVLIISMFRDNLSTTWPCWGKRSGRGLVLRVNLEIIVSFRVTTVAVRVWPCRGQNPLRLAFSIFIARFLMLSVVRRVVVLTFSVKLSATIKLVFVRSWENVVVALTFGSEV